MPGPLIDCYVLSPSRSAAIALAYLDTFLPDRLPSFAASDPEEVLNLPRGTSIQDVVEHLERVKDVSYNMYWKNRVPQPPYCAFLVYNDDGTLILGLSADVFSDSDHGGRYPEAVAGVLNQMERFAGTGKALCGVELPPPVSLKAFLNAVPHLTG